ncbi:N-6 DNA methylase [Streptomyces sp. NPDC056656]|uniref:N-6 DNA methylase n=1 Tax=Streptomyces sp. NPDC056656 TaxID=3345895 RepID=UPI0036A8CF50
MPPREMNQRAALDVAWRAADHLRGSIDATRYKNTLLPLLFLRHLSAQAEAGEGRQLPPAAQWDTLTRRISEVGSDAAAVLDEAFVELMRMHRDLTDAFAPAESLLDGLSSQQITDLFALLHNSWPPADEAVDAAGAMFTNLSARFAAGEGRRGGDFHTPQSVARLLVDTLQPRQGRVYDPCCGLGGLLAQAAMSATADGIAPADLTLVGQELNADTARLARMNLGVHGLSTAGIHRADTLEHDLMPTLEADVVLARPPFGLKWRPQPMDPRWRYGIPPRSNADYAWLQHALHKVSAQGSAGVVLGSGSMFRGVTEAKIREAMVEDDVVACIVALPTALFTTTGIPSCAWFLTKDKSSRREQTLADRRGETLFIDASGLGHMAGRAHRVLSDGDLDSITGAYRAWRGTHPTASEYQDMPGFCRTVSVADIREQEYNLSPGRYVGNAADGPGSTAKSVHDTVDELTRDLLDLLAQAELTETKLRRHLGP